MDNKWIKLFKDYEVHCNRIAKATTVDIGETAADKLRRVKQTEKDYIDWFEYYFPHYAKVKSAPYHKKLARKIIGNKKIKLLAEIFRSGGKSVHIDMGIPMYLMVTGQLKFMLLIGETEIKAKQLLGDIQAELEFNQRFINDYGRKLGKGTWAEGNFFTSDGIRFVSLGFGQSPRGIREGAERPDYIVIDDVDTKKHVNNSKIMSDSVDYIFEEVLGCFDAADNAIERLIYANNNFHKNSITNRLKAEFQKNIKLDKENSDESQYYILSVPAVSDLVTFSPTWPEKTTADYWRKKYVKRPRSFLREYMHRHVEEGKIFKAEYMHWKKMLPLRLYDALICIGDLSYKDKADFKGMFLIGKIKKEYHIIHSFLRQTSRQHVASWLYDLYEERNLHRYNIRYLIDGLFAQDEFVNDFDREGDERGYYIPVIANKKAYGNKFDHIESTDGVFIKGWVFWNIDEKEQPDQVEAIDQYLAFEKGSQIADDGPDAVAVGFKELDKSTYIQKFDPMITQRHNYTDNRY